MYYDVGLTHIGQVRLGTIWQRQKKIGEIPLEEEIFHVDFSDGGWSIAGPWDRYASAQESKQIVSQKYPLPEKARHPKTRVVQFQLSGNPAGLVVPCLEVFSRLYGRSQYVKRILVTQPFDVAYDSLIVPDIVEASGETWQVTLDKHCVDGDGTFLAHLKYDETTRKRVRRIWAKSEVAQDIFGSAHAFPGIAPWFTGPAQLKVKGIWLDEEKRRFLALQIEGGSDPDGVGIYLDRANTNVTGALRVIKKGTSWPLVREVKRTASADIQITYRQEPSATYATEEIEDDGFVVLGEPRKMTRVRRESTSIREKPTLIEKLPAAQISGGAVCGGARGVAPTSIAAPQIAAVDSFLMATWKTLRSMAQEENSPIQKVGAVTANGHLVFTGPVIIGFPNPKSKESGLSDSAKAWVYLDHKAKTHVRGVMLLQVTTAMGVGYILEIQRRPSRTYDNKPQSSGAYQYLAFSPDVDTIVRQKWIAMLVRKIANSLGVVSKVSDHYTGTFRPFNHLNENRGGIRGSILNGLKGVGLIPNTRET